MNETSRTADRQQELEAIALYKLIHGEMPQGHISNHDVNMWYSIWGRMGNGRTKPRRYETWTVFFRSRK